SLSSSPSLSYTLSLHDALPISRVVEGRTLVVEDDIVAAVLSHLGDHERRRALLEALRHGLRDVERHEGVEPAGLEGGQARAALPDRKSTRLNSSHDQISYAVFC